MAAGTTRQVELTATRWCGGWLVLLELAQQFPIYTAAKLSFFFSPALCNTRLKRRRDLKLEAASQGTDSTGQKVAIQAFFKKVFFLSGKLSGIRRWFFLYVASLV